MCLSDNFSQILFKYYSEMVTFEDWDIMPFSQTNREPESAINLAQLNWQGSDKNWILLARLFLSVRDQ